jgi:hypothetical protein
LLSGSGRMNTAWLGTGVRNSKSEQPFPFIQPVTYTLRL